MIINITNLREKKVGKELFFMKSSKPQRQLKKYTFVHNIYKHRFLYILVLPALVYTLIFNYVPLPGVIMAFQNFDILKGFSGSEFVGLKHFETIFTMDKFTRAIKNTLLYSSVTMASNFVLPIALALLFNELRNLRFKKVVQTISYMPYFISWASVIALVYAFFATYGPFNDVMVSIMGDRWERINPLMDAEYFLEFIVGTNIWKNLGWSSVIYMAAITGIDASLYEASDIDGAGRLQKVIYITLPSIMPTAVILLIMGAGGIVSSNFEQVYGLQNLYTQEATEVINTLVYRQGLCNGEYSLATAFGLFQGIVSFAIVIVVNKIGKKLANISIW